MPLFLFLPPQHIIYNSKSIIMKTVIFFVILTVALLAVDVKYGFFRQGRTSALIKIIALSAVYLLSVADYFLMSETFVFLLGISSNMFVGAMVLSCCRDDSNRVQAGNLRAALLVLSPAMALMLPLIWVRGAVAAAVKLCVTPVSVLSAKTLCAALIFRSGYAKVVSLFSNDKVWSSAVDVSEGLYLHVSAAVPLLSAAAYICSCRWLLYVVSPLSGAVFAVFYLRASTGRTLFVPYSKEKEILSIIRGSLRAVELQSGVGDGKMKALYRKIMGYMEEKKPYLDNDIDLDYFARKMFTNKVYLSRTINIFSGRNFRQFINYHRIEHSLELMRKDPYLRIEEVSSMSGFNSTVSYNMAFRMFKGMTPREWLDRYRDGVKL